MNAELYTACLKGDIEMVELAIKKGAYDFNIGLQNACRGGHKEIVELMIRKGADNYNYGMRYASEGGHLDIIELMIEKGAKHFTWSLLAACVRDHNHIMKLMLDKGADINVCYLSFEKIYYLLQAGITNFGKHSDIAECKKHLVEFQNVVEELVIKDVANIITKY